MLASNIHKILKKYSLIDILHTKGLNYKRTLTSLTAIIRSSFVGATFTTLQAQVRSPSIVQALVALMQTRAVWLLSLSTLIRKEVL